MSLNQFFLLLTLQAVCMLEHDANHNESRTSAVSTWRATDPAGTVCSSDVGLSVDVTHFCWQLPYVRFMFGYEDSKDTFYDSWRNVGRTLYIIGTVIPRGLAHRSALFFSAVFCSTLELRATVLISQDGPKCRLFPVPTSPTLRSSRCRTNRIKIEGGKRRGGGYCGDGDGG